MADLPPLVQRYLRRGDFTGEDTGPGTGPVPRIAGTGMPFRAPAPHDPVWRLHYERRFHDDEFWNGGMYLIWWLFQFAAGQGHLAVMLLQSDTPPEIYTRVGDDVVTTTLGYTPETHRALDYRDTPPDPDAPIPMHRSRWPGARV